LKIFNLAVLTLNFDLHLSEAEILTFVIANTCGKFHENRIVLFKNLNQHYERTNQSTIPPIVKVVIRGLHVFCYLSINFQSVGLSAAKCIVDTRGLT